MLTLEGGKFPQTPLEAEFDIGQTEIEEQVGERRTSRFGVCADPAILRMSRK